MNTELIQLIEEGLAASLAGTGNFGEHVMKLAKHGVESYRVDYRLKETAYFLPNGETHVLPVPVSHEVGPRFEAGEITSAIRGSQAGQVKWPEFIERSMRAGCVGYTVWISGRHVTYFGRNGETHVEHFPS
ncbi:MAG: hypothetical protein ACO1OB_18130 [Archangium sp.]